MEFDKVATFSIFVLVSLITCPPSVMANNPNKGAYWPSWSIDRFPPSSIDTTFFSHVYFAFLSPNSITFKFNIDNSTASLLRNFTTTLHKKNPPVKTMFSIGGASDGASIFARMASGNESRKSFILSTIEVARKFDFDGIDLDWEYPQTPNDMMNFHHLLYEWRSEVNREAKASGRGPLLLSAATYFSPNLITLDSVYRVYPVDSINKYLDWINAMCYDYHGAWDTSATGAHAALYDPNSNISTSYGLQSWIRANIQKEKLIMGLPLYGRTWQLRDPSVYGIGAPAVDVGPGDEGQLVYSDIEKFNAENNATVVFDLSTVSTYSVAGTSWIGYDDVRSITLKVSYAKDLQLGGYFFWAINGDHDWKISRTASDSWS